jgi:hypothetical protein
MPYESYTPPEDIRPDTRKEILRREYELRGEAAMRKMNKKFQKPIKDSSMATWLSHWHYLEDA